VVVLGGSPTTDDDKDRGIQFNWHDGAAAKTGFFGFDDSTGYLTFIPDATNSNEVFSGTLGTIDANGYQINSIGNLSAGSAQGTGTVTVDSWAIGAYRSAKYEYQITQGSSYQVGELRLYHDGTTATINEYATMGSLGTFSVTITAGNVVLSCAVSNSSTIKFIKRLIVI
jgi:hypothetical protein